MDRQRGGGNGCEGLPWQSQAKRHRYVDPRLHTLSITKKGDPQFYGKRCSIGRFRRRDGKEVESVLKKSVLIRKGGKGVHSFFVTDAPDRFIKVGRRFLGEKVESAVRIER
jgi:hypothetical protein